MVKNTGRPSEDIFDAYFQRLGKYAHVHVFTDAAEATGMNRKTGIIKIKPQPADRLVTYYGQMEYAEVKSTVEPKRFDFKLLRTKQSAQATMILSAGGRYVVYLHMITPNLWFRIPYEAIIAAKATGVSSIPIDNLGDYRWNPYPPTQ